MTERITLHCIDGDSRVRAELASATFAAGHHAEVYSSLAELAERIPRQGIVLARDDPGGRGFSETIRELDDLGIWLPLVAADDRPTTGRIVAAMKAGALDYLLLPATPDSLTAMIVRIAREAERAAADRKRRIEARGRIAALSNREREVLDWLSEGSSNKVIARELAISPRTVEIHRANMMHKLGARHTAEAVRLRLEAQIDPRPPA
ncbi:LuxR C-terminal-related transcriptional regulator [Parerythrobacter aurantius]|uniref:response regulator transcription factor n=1 Tax=Parerythrobacter aurantius TaxID=3127706 RepID=UPI0032553E75